MRRVLAVLAAGFSMAGASAAHADGVYGYIKSVYFSMPGNAPFRVVMVDTLPGCTGNFAFVDTSFGNYQAYVSGLLTAHSQQKKVLLNYTVQSDGFCRIVEYGYE